MSEIKPCPFCGSKNVRLIKREEAPEAFVTCNNCDIASETNEQAIKNWNTRHGEKAVLDKVLGKIDKEMDMACLLGYQDCDFKTGCDKRFCSAYQLSEKLKKEIEQMKEQKDE